MSNIKKIFLIIFVLILCTLSLVAVFKYVVVPENIGTTPSLNNQTQDVPVGGGQITKYSNPKYLFSMVFPNPVYDFTEADGEDAFKRFFTSKPVGDDFNNLPQDEYFIALIISKDERVINNKDTLEKSNTRGKISKQKSLNISGVNILRQFEDFSEWKDSAIPGCNWAAYFSMRNVSYYLVLSGKNCNVVLDKEAEFDAIINGLELAN